MRNLLFFLLSFFFLVSNGQKVLKDSIESSSFQIAQQDTLDWSFVLIPSVKQTWGYDIYRNNKLLIHQLSIPSVAGNEGFKRKLDAEKVAKLVIEKLKKGEMPPTITSDDLTKLKVLK